MTSEPLNERRRELLQTLLVVAGIVGGITGSVGFYASPRILDDLIYFIFAGVFLYMFLMSELRGYETVYRAVALVVSFLFSLTMVSILSALGNSAVALPLLLLGTILLTISLTYDWDKTPKAPKEAETTKGGTVP